MAATPNPLELSVITVRPARLADASAFASLATQLGYPSSPNQIMERMTTLLDDPKQLMLAAVLGDHVLGWAHAYVCCLVESDLCVELGGLVVDENCRNRGVGGKLLERVEDWARQNGCRNVTVRSNVIRREAHKFYLARGYDHVKTQHTFRKQF